MKRTILFNLLFLLNLTTLSSQNLDYQILKDLNKYQSPSDNRFNQFISDAAAPLSISTPLVMFGVGLIQKNQDLKSKGIQTGIAFAVTLGETIAIKYIVNRPRPYITHPDLKNVTTERSPSFPSGHTSSVFSIATSLSLIILNGMSSCPPIRGQPLRATRACIWTCIIRAMCWWVLF